MCELPSAIEMQNSWSQYENSDDVYVVAAVRNIDDEFLLEYFQEFHEVTYPVSSSQELGSYYDSFNEGFVAISENNILSHKLHITSEEEDLDNMIDESKAIFNGAIYSAYEIENFFLEENNYSFNLTEVFNGGEGNNITYSILSNSNTDAVEANLIDNNILEVNKTDTRGSALLKIEAEMDSGFSIKQEIFIINPLDDVYENFESIEFNDGDIFWNFTDGDIDFQTTDITPFIGERCALSGDMSSVNGTSEFGTEFEVTQVGKISFAYKISTSGGWNEFNVYIDDELEYSWFGEQDWNYFSFYITPGVHNIRFEYLKDSDDFKDNCVWLDAISFPTETLLGVDESNYELAITNYELKQNYPNPFNPVTKISFQLAVNSEQLAEIVVHNSAGQQVWSSPITVHSSQLTGSILFNGSKFNSGIYYYSLVVDGKKLDTKSMILIK